MNDQTVQPLRIAADAVAGTTLLAVLGNWLPYAVGLVGGVLSVIWLLIQLYESRTISGAIDRWMERRRLRRVRRLTAKQKVLIAKLAAAETVRSSKAVAVEMIQSAKAEATIAKAVADTPVVEPTAP